MKRRITDNGELRYSLRSIRKYASWIEKIHIITNGHPPSWLDLSHPAINHVIHEEIFPDTSVLPTFNSYAIECNLHRISSLSPCFLYFNDDFFLGRSIEVSTFIRDDELRFYAVPHTIGAKRDEKHSIYYNSAVYSQNYMRSRIGVSPLTHFPAHTPQLYEKKVLDRMDSLFEDLLNQTRKNRYRTEFDNTLSVTYSRYYAIGNESKKITEEVLPYGSDLYFFISLSEKHWIKRITELIRLLKNKPLFFCINDDIDHHDSFRAKWLFLLMKLTLQRLFPEPAPWEKDQYTL